MTESATPEDAPRPYPRMEVCGDDGVWRDMTGLAPVRHLPEDDFAVFEETRELFAASTVHPSAPPGPPDPSAAALDLDGAAARLSGPRAYPAADPGQPSLPSEWGWLATEPRLHHHRIVDGRHEAFDPRSEGEIDYEVLRDAIIAAFNPPDDDVAEPSLMTDALDRAWEFIVAQPCTCPKGTVGTRIDQHDSTITDYFGLQCARCQALGRSNDVRIER